MPPLLSKRPKLVASLAAFLTLTAPMCLVTPVTASAASGISFPDVTNDYWAKSMISALTTEGIVNGEDGLFHPERAVTRAEFAKLLVMSLKLQLISPAQPTFRDVSPSDWSYRYIETAYANHLVLGEENSRFAPNDPVSRQDFAKMVVSGLPIPFDQVHPIIKGMLNFNDQAGIADYAKPYVATAGFLHLVNGKENNRFAPIDTATRAEAVTILYRMQNLTSDQIQQLKVAPPLPATSLVFDRSNYGSYTAGNAEYVTVNALDSLNRVVTSETGRSVHLTVNLPNGKTYPIDTTLNGGTAHFQINNTDAGHYTLQASADQLSGSSSSFDVRPGNAAGLKLLVSPSTLLTPGETVTIGAEAVDAYNNATSVNQNVNVSLSAQIPQTVAGQVYTAGPSSNQPGNAAPVTVQGSNGLAQSVSLTPNPNGVSYASFGALTSGLSGNSTNAQFPLTISTSGNTLTSDSLQLNLLAHKSDLIAGKGIWMMWRDWHNSSNQSILDQLTKAGITHAYLEVATSSDGFYGQDSLEDFLNQAHRKGIAVIGWTYDALANPAGDANRDLSVAAYRTVTKDGVDALAPDIEDTNYVSQSTVDAYSQMLRTNLGANYPLFVCTFPPQMRSQFPWGSFGKWYDAIIPMDYWHYRWKSYSSADSQKYITDSISQIRSLTGRSDIPVSIAGQGYNMFDSDPGDTQMPTASEVQGALQGAIQGGAVGFSLYRYGTMPQWMWDVFNSTPYSK